MPKGEHFASLTACPQGHPYDEENTRIYQGRRYCRACHRDRGRKNQPQRRAWYERNKDRLNAKGRAKLAADPEARKRNSAGVRRWRLGVTQEQYDQMLADQGGVCAICSQPETRLGRSGEVKSLAVDHDHATGAIRQLLCSDCNQALGFLRDSPELVTKAAEYLTRHAE